MKAKKRERQRDRDRERGRDGSGQGPFKREDSEYAQVVQGGYSWGLLPQGQVSLNTNTKHSSGGP